MVIEQASEPWGWSMLIHQETKARQLVPNLDTRGHQPDQQCWCHPWVDAVGTLVHNSRDRRELYEQKLALPH